MANLLGPVAVGLGGADIGFSGTSLFLGLNGRFRRSDYGGRIIDPNRLVESLPKPAQMAGKHLELALELRLDLHMLDLINEVSPFFLKMLKLRTDPKILA